MNRKAIFYIALLLMVCMLSLACESDLYPPTDPPTLSNIVLTSDSYRDATSIVREGDMVFVSVDVTDPEGDPETLSLSVQTGGSEVINNEVSSSRIFNDETWETWFDSEGLTIGSYSISLSATDGKGNESDPVSKDFTISADTRPGGESSSGTGMITIDSATWVVKDTIPGEPFTISFTVTNISPLTIDRLNVPFAAIDSGGSTLDEADGVLTNIAPGDSKTGDVRLYIQLTETCDHLDYNEAASTVYIY